MEFYSELFKWLDTTSKQYKETFLIPKIDIIRFLNDNDYATKKFILYWAYERPNAPMAYKIATIKAKQYYNQQENVEYKACFEKFYTNIGKLNESRNPGYDSRIIYTNFCLIAKTIMNGDLEAAFKMLQLSGIGHKIKTFFIRDIISLTDSEEHLENDINRLVYTQPMDIWIEKFMELIEYINIPSCQCSANSLGTYKKNLEYGLKIIQLSRDAGVSPIKVNQAIWFFCSRIVADTKRLKTLIESRDINQFQKEMELVGEFIVT